MEFIYRLYGILHQKAKGLLGRSCLSAGQFRLNSIKTGDNLANCVGLWLKFIEHSTIRNKDYAGLHYAGFIAENSEWCLPSWIWTNAAIVRLFCNINEVDKAISLAEILCSFQQDCGGWIVRNDYDSKGAVPMLAPNDSAYIANNAFLSLYETTKDIHYLEIAEQCADWIIETSRPDGLVYTGYNMRDQKWDKDNVIVDTGFTAGLFAKLVEITDKDRYKEFLEKFVYRYIELFYMEGENGFCTSISKHNQHQGGMFARGQAWALEGLIPSYKILKDDTIKNVIDDTVDNLLKQQLPNGGWSYNLTRKLMGEDCKAVPVIAKNMMDWYAITGDKQIVESVKKALKWCCKHTCVAGEAIGGIFSYSVEGGIVKDLYTSCAFVYASAYAIQLNKQLEK